MSGVWVLLTQANADSWLVGGPVVLVGTFASMRLAYGAAPRFRFLRILFFLGYFLHGSFLGGIDVIWRSLHPGLPIQPGLVNYPLQLPKGAARTLFMAVVSLLPGTVSTDINGDLLVTHVIDDREPVIQQLEKLERVVASMFAIPLRNASV
ncbi:Na+/H+ antiporter subunit E [Rubripirellula obstinata]|uniref:Na+/H+ antiporter subunit E n=1 Tax=Rubripirellula obstinata TaxID=406547 RepID=UPI001390313E|nr:Na+/H+ antiporter subunit E [Rubripirellula obstinata]